MSGGSTAFSGATMAATRRPALAASSARPRRCVTVAKLPLVGGDGPSRKPVQPPAALPQTAAAFSPVSLHPLLGPAGTQQQVQPPQSFLLEEVQRLEKSFNMTLAVAGEGGSSSAAVLAGLPATADADSALEDIFSLLDDMEGLATELDSAVATSTDFGTLTEEDFAKLEEQRRKEDERRRAAAQRVRRPRVCKDTTASTRTRSARTKTSAAAAASAATTAAAAAQPAPASGRAVATDAVSSSSSKGSVVPFSGAALRSAARTQQARQWGRAAAPSHAPVRGKAATAARRAAAAAALEADPLTFMRSISKGSLLTAEQERRLAAFVQDRQALIEAAAVFRRQHRRPPSEAEWAEAVGAADGGELRQRLAVGLQARAHMVNCNMRLVVSIAKKYVNRGMPLQDLVAEGMVGLHRGVDKFDPTKGFKFSTYAHWWIRQAVSRCVADQARVVRLPVHLHEAMGRVRRAEQALWDETGVLPSAHAVAERCGLPYARLMALYKSFRTPVSRDANPNDDDRDPNEMWVEDAVEDDDPAELAHYRMMKEDLNSVLLTLSERECGIIKMRYGLDDGEEKTLEEVGRAFNVTRERIRQIEAKAIRKLRSPSRVGQLTAF